MKKLLLLFMAVLTMSLSARAADGDEFTVDNLRYRILSESEHEVSLIGYNHKPVGDLSIPTYVINNQNRYLVTTIGRKAFEYCTGLTSVVIPTYVTEIESAAFEHCNSLISVSIPDSVTGFGDYAFRDCTELTSISIPSSMSEIELGTFSGCSGLTSIKIPKSVTKIGNTAFEGCNSLTFVSIPNSVTQIDCNPFQFCTALQEIVVEDGNVNYTSIDGVLYEDNTLISYPGGKEGSFEIPNSVTEIGKSAFAGCIGLTSISIPNSVTVIHDYVFYGCSSLKNVSIPDSMTEIGEFAFSHCTALSSIPLPNAITEIGSYTFSYCTEITSIVIPTSLKIINNDLFKGCTKLTSITITGSVTEIGSYAFEDCINLNKIVVLTTTPPTCSIWGPFHKVPETAIIYVPKGALKKYFVADGWNYFTDFREMGALDITLNQSSITVEKGETFALTATVTKDDDVSIESETWTSSNPEVATVDNGVVTTVGAGTATITYTVVDGYGCPHTESCTVTVTDNSGIEGIGADDSNAPAEYFNLNGVRVSGNVLTPGLYIKRQGGKTSKVLVR